MNVQQHKISAVVQKYPLTSKSKLNGQNNNLKTYKIQINPSVEKLLKILWYFISSNIHNKRLSQSSSSSTIQDSIQSSATINHIEMMDSEGGTSSMNPSASNDYEYRDPSLPDWLPPPPPPPPKTFSLLPFTSAPQPLESSPYPSPTSLSPFNILPRRRPFDQRPLDPGLDQQDELTLFLVILTIAGFFGLIISMFLPFSLLLKSHQQSLGSPIGGFQPSYPYQPGFIQTPQFTSSIVAGRRRRKRDESWTINTVVRLHNASTEFN
uniref:Uncharacterized protein n=1 Tax=Tetranychus urticae TaxID=32264 RepID=T1JUE0_TETUR